MAADRTKGGRPPRVVAALQAAMAEIEQDIGEEGVYPFNGGRLSQAELCRRAKVAPATLQNPNHLRATLPWVNRWLASTNKALARGKTSVRKAVTRRTDEAKYELANALTQLNLSQIELARATAERDAALARLAQERDVNAALRSQLKIARSEVPAEGGNVVPM